MRLLIFLPLLSLAACSKPAEKPAPASVAAVPVVTDTWPGKYEGDLRVDITGTAGAYKASLFTANERCDGEIGLEEGGVAAGETTASRMMITAKDDYHDQTCHITIDKSGDTLTIAEDDGCTTYHGVFCSFNGTAKRVK